MRQALFSFLLFLFVPMAVRAQSLLSDQSSFPISSAVIYVDDREPELVQTSAKLLQKDIALVLGKTLPIVSTLSQVSKNVIAIGTIGQSDLIKQLVSQKKISLEAILGKWEGTLLQTINKPAQGIPHALVIAGNDWRGTAYGVFELSKQLGVSPWYWWADVHVEKRKEIYLKEKFSVSDAPKVKYRGIFINDEAPALSGWSKEKFGSFNHHFYEHVFKLILRLKGNYLWPAMWRNAFYADDSLNIKMADQYGIVIGTSHHEPLMRAHDEWKETNTYADQVKKLYANDSLITRQHHQLNNGKWNHLMDQTHIGYTYWQQPKKQKMPGVRYLPADSIVGKKEIANREVKRAKIPGTPKGNVFYQDEKRGVSIEAHHFTKAVTTNGIQWKALPDHGRTGRRGGFYHRRLLLTHAELLRFRKWPAIRHFGG